ncbi:MAG: diguanylate cyclase [Thermodesulfobacteriota bacterium]|nr:diguanylate cyclase [Thermodesulfobacteriota bacterium]
MRPVFNQISQKISALFSILFSTSVRQSDHKRLAQYIIALNQKKLPIEIINEASQCLKDILDYRLFAFVIQNNEKLDVWLDPRMYKKSLESIIINDFNVKNKSNINYLNHSFQDDEQEKKISMKNLVSYDLWEEYCTAKIYMLPNHSIMNYHEELVNIILKSTGVAISRQMNIAQLTDAATLDPLTGCYNRRELESQMKRHIARTTRHNSPLSIFMLDIDHFKKVNDTYGHQAGDDVLKDITRSIQQNIRAEDILARYGGEEFIVILPETDKHAAMELADRLRDNISKKMIKTATDTIKITASFGVAAFTPHTNMEQLIKEADEMLYKAKLNGRNIVMPGLIKICSHTNTNYFEN